MIQPPKRAVTRFLIPFIDVLILLFCIFLLMPFVSRPADSNSATNTTEESGAPVPVNELKQQIVDLQLKLEQSRQEVEMLRKERANPANRLSVRVLEIDAQTGKLFYFDPDSPDPRQELRDQADAQRLIDQQRRLARGKDAFFLILYPRQLTGYPLQSQIETYRRWFQTVPVGFDNPWSIPGS